MLVQAMEYDGMDAGLQQILTRLNAVFTIAYTVELAIKVSSL
jgi:hypothetical protein